MKKILSALLVATMLLPGSVFAAEPAEKPEPQPWDAPILITMDKADSVNLKFDLSALDVYTYETVKDDTIIWTLKRTASYANGGEIIPLVDEEEMFPNEKQEMDLEAVDYRGFAFSCETAFNDADQAMTLDITTTPAISRGNPGAPHASGGDYMDYCGTFDLIGTAEDGTVVAEHENFVIKPYESFHTMWEIYEELEALADQGDDDASTTAPYVVKESMGQSNAGYDMPYLIVAKDSAAVENWLDLCEEAETDPEGVLEKLESLDYQVPVMYSNVHANEVAAADGVLEFAKMLVEDETISYEKLTGLTDAGIAKKNAQRAELGLHVPELVADKVNFLGSIWPQEGSQTSGKVAGFDDYYDSETAEVSVDALLDDVFFLLVPEENVEGRMYITRTSSGGYDLNRDNSFQTQAETRNMQHLIATFNPVTLLELHGQITEFQVEPCSPPHEPNVEYDLLSNHLMHGGEAFGAAAVANNDDYQSYVIPMRDYLTSDENGDPYWQYPWDDMSTSYTPQFAMLQGCVAYTVELPAYSDSARTAATYGLVGLSEYVAANKASYFEDQLNIYARSAANENTDAEVGPWLVDSSDVEGAEADLFRPAYDGEGENGQFFPECYIIPLDSKHQTNLQAAYDMIEWLTRNDVKVGITDESFEYDGVTYPTGTMIVSMYQAKRSVANGVLYDGTVIRNWTDLYSEGITAFNHTRGFDMITCAEPDAYETIAAAVGETLDYADALDFLDDNAGSQFTGKTGGDVIISNASEDSTAAVNALLKSGTQVAMITEGANKGDFICSYQDWKTVADDYVLSGTGVKNSNVTAYLIEKAPVVYISGTEYALEESSKGYVHTNLVSDSASYNYDRMAMEMMNFDTTEDADEADIVIGATALDDGGLAAVKNGVPYVGYTSWAMKTVSSKLLKLSTDGTDGMDCLGYVIYPDETLANASYINDGDDVFYGYGNMYFTEVPEGAKVLVQGSGEYPMEGFFNGDEESFNAFLNGIYGISYQGKDMNGNDVDLTLFANTLTNKAHQRDEYAFISNTIFASLLSDTAYETASGSSSGGSSSGSASKPAQEPETSFDDVASDAYYADAVEWAVENSVTNGSTASIFNPNGICTRAQTVTFLWRAAGCPAPESTVNPFTDVTSSAYYYNAVLWAVEQGITKGTTETTFSPDKTVTRAQTVTFLWRAEGAPAVTGSENPFADVAADAYFADAVVWAVSESITNGVTASSFAPNNGCTRAQIVTMLYRCFAD